MKLLVALLIVTATTLAPFAHARPDLPYCSGYAECSQKAHDGWAVFCIRDDVQGGRWYCMECESCGNGPPIQATPRLLP
jgi:hypothetical protein